MKKYFYKGFCWISISSLILSSLTFLIYVFRSFTFTNDAVIGVVSTMIGICATFMVGWQIFSSMQVRDELKEICKLNDKLKKTTEEQDKKLEEEKKEREKQNKRFDAKISYANALALSQIQLLSSYYFFLISAKNHFELGDFRSGNEAIDNLRVPLSRMKKVLLSVNNGGDIQDLVKIDYMTNISKRLESPTKSPIEEMKKLTYYSMIQEKIESSEAQRKEIIEKAKK